MTSGGYDEFRGASARPKMNGKDLLACARRFSASAAKLYLPTRFAPPFSALAPMTKHRFCRTQQATPPWQGGPGTRHKRTEPCGIHCVVKRRAGARPARCPSEPAPNGAAGAASSR